MNKLYFLQKNIISVSQRLGFCHTIPRVLCENNPVYSVIQIFVAAMVLSWRVCLEGVEFLRRFTLHILPARFVKIRYFGIYNHTFKRKQELQFVPDTKPDIDILIKNKESPETRLQRFERLTGYNPCQCPVCKKGRMVVLRELPRIRSPGRLSTSEFLLPTF